MFCSDVQSFLIMKLSAFSETAHFEINNETERFL